MKHRIGFNRLGRKAAHRKAMTRNMVTSLFRYERVRTTKAKALEVRKTAEKMITRAKEDSVHNRRQVGRNIKDKSVLAKLFTDIGPRFKERPGGYTRILRLGPRQSDAAEMVLLELVGQPVEEAPKNKKKSSSKKESPSEKPAKTAKDSGESKSPAEPKADSKAKAGSKSQAKAKTEAKPEENETVATEAAAEEDEK